MALHENVHEPAFSDTTTEPWELPAPEAYDAEHPATLAERYLVSESGFPPASVDDLHAPVVDTDGRLNRNALQEVRHGVGATEPLSDEETAAARELAHELLEEHFPERDDPEAVAERLQREAREEREEERLEQHMEHDDEVREGDAREVANPDNSPDEMPNE